MKILPYFLFFGFVAYLFVSNANRGKTIREKDLVIASTQSALSDTVAAHGDTRRQYGALKDYSGKQEVEVANLGKENANLKAANDRAETSVYKSQVAQREKDRQLIETNAKLSRAEKQALLARLQQGGLSTDSLTTILNLQAQLTDRDSVVIPGLNRQVSRLESEVSDLEIQANNDRKAMIAQQSEISSQNNAVADRIEAVPRGFANIGYGKRIRKATNDIRAGRVRHRR